MRCGDQQAQNLHTVTCICGLVQTSNTKARPQSPHFKAAAEDVLPRSFVAASPKIAGYKGERLRRKAWQQ